MTTQVQQYWSHDPRTGEPLVAYSDASAAEIDTVMARAATAAEAFAAIDRQGRARALDAIVDALELHRERLVSIADRETALGAARLDGELTRSQTQLRLYGGALREGWPAPVIDEVHLPTSAKPVRLELERIALGPVVVFAASNFPFAFSVPGTDTAAALAAGCPVVVKIHPLHPATSEATGEIMAEAMLGADVPEGALALVHGAAPAVGEQLVTHPATAAVAFTGSRGGGLTLARIAASRPDPIPFYGELGSINPVIIGRTAWAERADGIADALAGAILQGYGQFCTSPGLVLAPDASHVAEALSARLAQAPIAPMLGERIAQGFGRAVSTMEGKGVHQLVARQSETAPAVFLSDADAVAGDAEIREEMFGPGCVVVDARNADEIAKVLATCEGQLTVTVMAEREDEEELSGLAAGLGRLAGRIVWNGVPTGVAVSPAMHHGGPFPASTDPRSTSVGTGALDRFVRPICLQGVPATIAGRIAPGAGTTQ